MATSKYSHDLISWSGPQAVPTSFANVGASQAFTSLIGSSPGVYGFSPFPYACVYDVLVHVTASSNGGGANKVDVYNTISAGAPANSYLSSPFTIPNVSANTPTTWSLRAQGLVLTPEIGSIAPGGDAWVKFCQTYVFGLNQCFSARASTPGGASITNLSVTMVLVASDLQFLTF